MACTRYGQITSQIDEHEHAGQVFKRKCSHFRLCVFKQKSVEIGNDLPGLKLQTLHVGGLPGDGNHVSKGFVGCIQVSVCMFFFHLFTCVFWVSASSSSTCAPHQGVRMGETSTNVANVNMAQGLKIRVEDGCDLADPCDTNICPENSHCSDDWSTHTCVCDPGNIHT